VLEFIPKASPELLFLDALLIFIHQGRISVSPYFTPISLPPQYQTRWRIDFWEMSTLLSMQYFAFIEDIAKPLRTTALQNNNMIVNVSSIIEVRNGGLSLLI